MRIETRTVWALLDPHDNKPTHVYGDEYMCRGAAKGILDRMVWTGEWDLSEQYPEALARICVPLEFSEFAAVVAAPEQ